MSTLAELTIFPMDKGESVSPHVAEALKIIRSSGLAYQPGPMGTCIEGEWDDVMAVVNRCMEALKKDSSRVYMVLKVDYREGKGDRISGKIRSVERFI